MNGKVRMAAGMPLLAGLIPAAAAPFSDDFGQIITKEQVKRDSVTRKRRPYLRRYCTGRLPEHR